MKVSQLSLGTMTFGSTTSERDAIRMVHVALDSGINLIDTANVYNEGRSETILGKALKQKTKRARTLVATKVHGSMDPHNPNAQGNSRLHLVEQCEASLRRLNTEYIDLYQIHRPSSEVAIDETIRALDDLTRAGKIRYFGTSTFAAWQVCEALWTSERLRLHRVVTEQPPYNLLDRRIERELIPMAQTHDIALLPWSPLAEGFLIGKYSSGNSPSRTGRLSQDTEWSQLFFSQQSLRVMETLENIARAKGCSSGHIALAWCMNQPGITSPIIGPRTIQQLKDNLIATTISLTHEEKKMLDTVAPPAHCLVPYYEADFGPRLHL